MCSNIVFSLSIASYRSFFFLHLSSVGDLLLCSAKTGPLAFSSCLADALRRSQIFFVASCERHNFGIHGLSVTFVQHPTALTTCIIYSFIYLLTRQLAMRSSGAKRDSPSLPASVSCTVEMLPSDCCHRAHRRVLGASSVLRSLPTTRTLLSTWRAWPTVSRYRWREPQSCG